MRLRRGIGHRSLQGEPKNPNIHPPSQLKLLARVIAATGWRAPIIISRRSGLVIKGHGRLAAAKLAGWTSVPVDFQDYENEGAELADMIADNKLAELAETDEAMLTGILAELDEAGIDQALAGIEVDTEEIQPPSEPPKTVEENMAELQEIKSQRKEANENIIAKNDTERYLVIVFTDRGHREKALEKLGLPSDERYVPANLVKIARRRGMTAKISAGVRKLSAAPVEKAGANG